MAKLESIRTAHYSAKLATDRVDITVKSGIKQLAPTWGMVTAYKRGELPENAYIPLYLSRIEQLRDEDLEALIHSKNPILVCFCPPGNFCHRVLLAEYLAKKFNIPYVGELAFIPE